MPDDKDFKNVRASLAAIHGEISNDAVGQNAPRLEDMFTPETHAAALDPATAIVVGPRGAGKSFWSGVLGQVQTRQAAALAYPRLGLDKVAVEFGFTGVGGPDGVSVDAIRSSVPDNTPIELARRFWWSTIIRACLRKTGGATPTFRELMELCQDWEERDRLLEQSEDQLRKSNETLLIIYDALDTVAASWDRRRLLTQALLEVLWAARAYRQIRTKIFVRSDQLDDDALQFVELPKLRTGAVKLTWEGRDLYGLLYARLALASDRTFRNSFGKVLLEVGATLPEQEDILTRRWPLLISTDQQSALMATMAGRFMADGPNGYKKGKTYEWPLTHLADAFDDVTPRSFLGLMIGAAKHGASPSDRVITPDGIREGLRAASKTRVDQLHQEFPWIKGVLVPLAGLLLPQKDAVVFSAWRKANTIATLVKDARSRMYFPPFPLTRGKLPEEVKLFEALQRIGVMYRRKDGRIDMPDIFRVAANLLKKGGIAP